MPLNSKISGSPALMARTICVNTFSMIARGTVRWWGIASGGGKHLMRESVDFRNGRAAG